MPSIRRLAVGTEARETANKFNARKVIVDGEVFDSKKEAYRYRQLKSLEKIHAIYDLRRQVEYVLIPKQLDGNGKVIEKQCVYCADFVYGQNGKTIVEDVKGYKKGAAYSLFVIKRKLMLSIHGIKIREV